MKEDLDYIIKQLERALEMMHKQRYDEVNDLIYEARSSAQFMKDHP